MRQFNQSIQVEISVDTIAKMLLDSMNPEFKHSELVVESIIGRMLANDISSLSLLYNSLNGYTQEIDFATGDNVICKEGLFGKWDNTENNYKRNVECVVKSINVYHNEKLCVEYVDDNGCIREKRVRHTDCSKIGIVELA